jgi:hypothetical protein
VRRTETDAFLRHQIDVFAQDHLGRFNTRKTSLQIAQLGISSFLILKIKNPFHQVASDGVFKTGGHVGDNRPVKVVMFGLLLDSAYLGGTEGLDSKDHSKGFPASRSNARWTGARPASLRTANSERSASPRGPAGA